MLQQITNPNGVVTQNNAISKTYPWWLVSKPVLTLTRIILI